MKRADREVWSQAKTIGDLCALTGRWLTGDLGEQPGYYGPVDVDEAAGLHEALIALNQAGFLTRCSQQGAGGVGYGGFEFRQMAAVEGFASPETLLRLMDLLEGACVEISAKPSMKWRYLRCNGDVVTWVNGQPHTWFGNQLGRRAIRFDFEDSPDAWPALYASEQFVIFDPVIGSNDLWGLLTQALEEMAVAL